MTEVHRAHAPLQLEDEKHQPNSTIPPEFTTPQPSPAVPGQGRGGKQQPRGEHLASKENSSETGNRAGNGDSASSEKSRDTCGAESAKPRPSFSPYRSKPTSERSGAGERKRFFKTGTEASFGDDRRRTAEALVQMRYHQR